MNTHTSSLIAVLLTMLFGACASFSANGQLIPIIEIQGEAEVSPYDGQTVTISGKVTEYFGDSWYMQDAFGAWNGVYVEGPDVMIPANSPYWNSDRQPEVGDVLEISGTVAEVDGNTQIIDAVLVDFVDFWNATPMGVWVTASEIQDEQYEGTRVRLDNATVLSAPDSDGYWTVEVEDGEVTCWGVDTDDPAGNEDPDGPTPGDVYQVYGASHQNGDAYVLHVGDIDVLSLGVAQLESAEWTLAPNPVSERVVLASADHASGSIVRFEVIDAQGMVIMDMQTFTGQSVDVSQLGSGVYFVRIQLPESGFAALSRLVKR